MRGSRVGGNLYGMAVILEAGTDKMHVGQRQEGDVVIRLIQN